MNSKSITTPAIKHSGNTSGKLRHALLLAGVSTMAGLGLTAPAQAKETSGLSPICNVTKRALAKPIKAIELNLRPVKATEPSWEKKR